MFGGYRLHLLGYPSIRSPTTGEGDRGEVDGEPWAPGAVGDACGGGSSSVARRSGHHGSYAQDAGEFVAVPDRKGKTVSSK